MSTDSLTLPPVLPEPEDDGAADHLRGMRMPSLALPSTAGGAVDVAALGATVHGLSRQAPQNQAEAAARLHLPLALLSDPALLLADALDLPTFTVAGLRLYRRLTLIVRGGAIEHVFYPVFPPDRHAADVLAWLR